MGYFNCSVYLLVCLWASEILPDPAQDRQFYVKFANIFVGHIKKEDQVLQLGYMSSREWT